MAQQHHTGRKLVILDRDGVLNYDSPEYIKSPAEWIPIPGSLQAIAKLNRAGYTVVIASNQSGLGRGLYDINMLHKIHAKLHEYVNTYDGKIDHIFFCPHTPDTNCDCRKPKPGLLLQIATHYQINLDSVPVIGDSLRDLEAAAAVNARPILVLTGNGQKTQLKLAATALSACEVYATFATATEILVKERLEYGHS